MIRDDFSYGPHPMLLGESVKTDRYPFIDFSRCEWTAQVTIGTQHYYITRDDREDARAALLTAIQADLAFDAGLAPCQHINQTRTKRRNRYQYVCDRCGASMGRYRTKWVPIESDATDRVQAVA